MDVFISFWGTLIFVFCIVDSMSKMPVTSSNNLRILSKTKRLLKVRDQRCTL